MSIDTHQYLELAKETALLAGRFILENIDQNKILSTDGKDIKLSLDMKSQELIMDKLKAESPFSILSEEKGGEHIGANTNYQWIIDPIDGSFNVSRKIPMCAVSIALFENEKPVIGVIYNFFLDELFYGSIDQAPEMNRAQIKTSSLEDPSQAGIVSGFPVAFDTNTENLIRYTKIIGSFKKVRMIGSATYSLALVACGKVEAYKEESINIWDVAAGIALIKFGGGQYKMKWDKETHKVDVIACGNSSIQNFLEELA